jgi:hypothetical protein
MGFPQSVGQEIFLLVPPARYPFFNAFFTLKMTSAVRTGIL